MVSVKKEKITTQIQIHQRLNANMKSLKNNKQTSVFSVKCKLQLKRKLNQGHIMVFSPEVSKIPKELDPIL